MESTNDELRELSLLERIESDPDVNQSKSKGGFVFIDEMEFHIEASGLKS